MIYNIVTYRQYSTGWCISFFPSGANGEAWHSPEILWWQRRHRPASQFSVPYEEGPDRKPGDRPHAPRKRVEPLR